MDNSPEAVKGRVRSMTKAIRYKARKEGNLIKAFNDFMGTQSGISATERSAVKKSLGLSENKYRTAMSDWRAELNEVVSGDENDKTIKEKKVKNKIVINPTLGMKEAFEAIGGEIIEMSEIVEGDMKDAPSIKDAKPAKKTDVKYYKGLGYAPTINKEEEDKEKKKREMLARTRDKDIEQGRKPGKMKEGMDPKEMMLQKKRANIDIQIAKTRKKQISKAGEAPTKVVGEGYDKPDEKLKTDRDGYRVPKKDADAARDRLLAKARAKRAAKMKESVGMHRDAKTGEVVDKAEVGKTYYPNMPKKKSSVALRKEKGMKEETEDSLRDKRMMRGGVDGNVRYDLPNRNPERKKPDPKAKKRAVDKVRDDIIKKYGKGALM